MTSSRIITLFSSPPPARRDSASIVVSILTHVIVVGLAVETIFQAPQITNQIHDNRYMVRIVKLQSQEPQIQWSPGSGGAQTPMHSVAHAVRPAGRLAAPAPPRQISQRTPSTRTLIQPTAPKTPPLLADAPMATVVLWRPESVPTPKIVLPSPPPKPVTADVRPSIAAPNRETNVADLELSSTTSTSATLPVPASTTTPISIRLPGEAAVPESSSDAKGQITPTAVVSVSDVLVTQGTVAIPLVNEAAAMFSSDSLAPGRPNGKADDGRGMAPDNQNGSGGTASSQGAVQSASNGNSRNASGTIGTGSGSSTNVLSGDAYAVDRVTLPRNGQFGVVVVGASLPDEYPETLGMWSGRMAYTVYLHVGKAKNWILQYSLPRLAKTSGPVTRPDPPWPYLMVSPHLLPGDLNADAIMVHGFINTDGRFDRLAVVFPPQFSQTKFVLACLKQWSFRPATENGQLTPVEVLLIIPDESD